jgi:hypothetical protein
MPLERAMPRCPKCDARKAKRFCPALEFEICPQCCAEHRLNTIRCPADCPHLRSEHYQLARRKERARSSGRRFLAALEKLFPAAQSRQFAFLLHADVFWWMQRSGRLENGSIIKALELVKERLSPVILPGDLPPLARFLGELLSRGSLHRRFNGPDFTPRHRARVIDAIAAYIRGLGAAGEHTYADELSTYFGQLDFEADLDYSPAEELEPAAKEGAERLREQRSGLIVPASGA